MQAKLFFLNQLLRQNLQVVHQKWNAF